METKIKENISDAISSTVLASEGFNSPHEAYTMILIKIDELQDELGALNDNNAELFTGIIEGGYPLSELSERGSTNGIKLIETAIQITALFAKLKDLETNWLSSINGGPFQKFVETFFTQSDVPHTQSYSDKSFEKSLPMSGSGEEVKLTFEDAINKNIVVDNGDGTYTLPASGSGLGHKITKEEYYDRFGTTNKA
jgi:hypothetical protein